MCVFAGAIFSGDPMSQFHELMLLRFLEDIESERQLLVMEALGQHLARCEGLIGRDYFCTGDGVWVEHVVWASQADLQASALLDDDPVVEELFDCFDSRTVSYLRGERVKPEGPRPQRGDEVASP
jgi:hypothetical protein